jgi:BirA family transcriptional regulator, biotin operon repressor / biotin---[acetyl-CoA-carboxylase] ligase
MPWGFPCRWLAETASTNDVARAWALRGAPDGAVVTARHQTRGRGRRERTWDSPAGTGLYLSVILRPDWPAIDAPKLAILAGMAAFTALQGSGLPNLTVKWPNDILASGRKICGVLVEPRIGAGRIEFAVLGMGINVMQQSSDFPAALQATATSCRMEGVPMEVDLLKETVVDSLQVVREKPFGTLRAEWLAAGAREEEPEI